MVRFSIHEDLQIEILTKLPIKSLFRFCSVSKSWNSLFSSNDDYFFRRFPLLISAIYYSSGSTSSSSCSKQPKHAFVSENGVVETTNFGFMPSATSTTIIDSCKGLLLTVSSENSKQKYFVCNPLTKRYTTIPISNKESLISILSYEREAEAFRVISVTEWRPQGGVLSVFSSINGEWTEHEFHWGIDSSTISPVVHCSDGLLYMLSYPSHILRVNLNNSTRSCDLIELPERVKQEGFIGSIGKKLHYVAGDGNKKYNVWMIEGDLNEESNNNIKWVLKCSFSLGDHEFGKQRSCSFVGFHLREEIVYLFVDGNLVSYDLKKGRFREVCRFGDEKENVYLIQLGVFAFSNLDIDRL